MDTLYMYRHTFIILGMNLLIAQMCSGLGKPIRWEKKKVELLNKTYKPRHGQNIFSIHSIVYLDTLTLQIHKYTCVSNI